MKRTLVLAALALAGLVAAFLLPRPHTPVPSPPPVEPVRVEGSVSLRLRPERSVVRAGGDELDVVVELSASGGGQARSPVDFALALDRSGSMSGEPMQRLRKAARSFVLRLEAHDRLALVAFGSDAPIALPATAMTEEGRAQALRVIDGLYADGGTNLSGALESARLALDQVEPRERAVRRIVLLTDGRANEGLVGPGLHGLAEELAGAGFRLSALGLGEEFDEHTLAALADAAGGRYRYLRSARELDDALAQELAEASATAASYVALDLESMPGAEIVAVYGFDAGARRLALRDLAAGETRTVVLRVRTRHAAAGPAELVRASLRYADVLAGRRPVQTDATARVRVSADGSDVERSLDADASRVALVARWGRSQETAAELVGSEGVSGARTHLKRAFDALQQEAREHGDPALTRQLEEQMRVADEALDSGAARKALHAGARQNHGL